MCDFTACLPGGNGDAAQHGGTGGGGGEGGGGRGTSHMRGLACGAASGWTYVDETELGREARVRAHVHTHTHTRKDTQSRGCIYVRDVLRDICVYTSAGETSVYRKDASVLREMDAM